MLLRELPLFCHEPWDRRHQSYNHKVHQHLPKLSGLLSGLADKIPPPKIVVISPFSQNQYSSNWETGWVGWDVFVKEGQQHKLGRSPSGEIEWNRLSFNAPLWILFSSGTTGRPKCVLRRIRLTCLIITIQTDSSPSRWNAFAVK